MPSKDKPRLIEIIEKMKILHTCRGQEGKMHTFYYNRRDCNFCSYNKAIYDVIKKVAKL